MVLSYPSHLRGTYGPLFIIRLRISWTLWRREVMPPIHWRSGELEAWVFELWAGSLILTVVHTSFQRGSLNYSSGLQHLYETQMYPLWIDYGKLLVRILSYLMEVAFSNVKSLTSYIVIPNTMGFLIFSMGFLTFSHFCLIPYGYQTLGMITLHMNIGEVV